MNNTSITVGDSVFSFDEMHRVLLDAKGKVVIADVQKISEGEYSVLVAGRSFHLFLDRTKTSNSATLNNVIVEIQLETMRDKLEKELLKESGTKSSVMTHRAPMPGMVIKLLKTEGSHVNAGDGILIVEAMKMENEIKSHRNGTLKKIFVQEKQTVEKNDNLFTIDDYEITTRT